MSSLGRGELKPRYLGLINALRQTPEDFELINEHVLHQKLPKGGRFFIKLNPSNILTKDLINQEPLLLTVMYDAESPIYSRINDSKKIMVILSRSLNTPLRTDMLVYEHQSEINSLAKAVLEVRDRMGYEGVIIMGLDWLRLEVEKESRKPELLRLPG